jgi:hypothetical protein
MKLWAVMLALGAVLLATGCKRVFGPLPNEAAALKAGCTVMLDRLPDRKVDCSRLEAALDGDTWTVGRILPKGYSGGGPVVKLSKADGRLLDFYVTQ